MEPQTRPPLPAGEGVAGKRAVHLAILLLGGYFLLFHGLFQGEIKPLDDGWNAGVARRIAEGGSWLSPTLQDGEFHNHGVLVHWIIATLFRIFGPLPGLARGVGATFGMALVLVVYAAGLRVARTSAGTGTGIATAETTTGTTTGTDTTESPTAEIPTTESGTTESPGQAPGLGTRRGDASAPRGARYPDAFAAFVAAFGLLSYEPFFHNAPRPLMDVPVTFWVFLALLAIDLARERPWAGYLAAGALTGVAIVTKDLAGLAPIPVAVILPLVERRPRALLHPAPYVGLVITAAVVAAWLVPQHFVDGSAWLVEYLKFGRWGIEEGAYPDRGPLFYVGHLAADYWPWLPLLLIALYRGGSRLRRGEPYALTVHFVVFVVVFLAWSAVAHKTTRYMMLFYPSAFLMVGDELDRWLRWPKWRSALVATCGVLVLGLGVAELAFNVNIHPSRSENGARLADLAPKATAAAAPAKELCTFRVHRYFLAAGFSYYRGPTVPIPLDFPNPEKVHAWLAPGSSHACITTEEGLRELKEEYPVKMNADGYVVVAARY